MMLESDETKIEPGKLSLLYATICKKLHIAPWRRHNESVHGNKIAANRYTVTKICSLSYCMSVVPLTEYTGRNSKKYIIK